VVLVLALWLSATIERRLLRDAVRDLSMRKVAANATRAALLLMGLLLALSAVGVDLTALSVLGGALGVGLGFGLQKLAANYVSGFVILLERSLRIGDTVKVDGFEGRVTDIKTRYTLIRANDGRESVVPNELIITQRIENLSLADSRVLMTLAVTVAYDSDVAQVQRILCEAATACERVLQEPAPAAYLERFGADGLEFTLALWIADPENGQLGLRSDINLRILQALRQAGIEIPYPQRVVYMRGQPVSPERV
jgi:small-conductance mechanosensitive channel